ncbi:MAG: 16S rRNA processing protein RimM [Marinilabiliales bacterium]|jgi:16S rRNA processing protein RimM|nr:MAG: 16S rRNA processing protein RimM [Marinilabiliales bacterium]
MEFDDYFFLGRILKPHGFDGRLNAFLDVDEPDVYNDLKMVFVNFNNGLVPYFINHIQILNNKAIISFQDIDNLEKAELLQQKEMYLPIAELPERTGNKFYFHEVIGFQVIDASFGDIGPISEILEYPNQAVMQIFHDQKEVLIPIFGNIIQKVDRDKKEIHVEAPDGLIDIYLNK